METQTSTTIAYRSIHSLQDLKPGSPNSRAAAARRSASMSSGGSHFIDIVPDHHELDHHEYDVDDVDALEASVGGNLALGSNKRSRRRRSSSARPLGRSGRSGSSRKHSRRGSGGGGGRGRRVRPGSSVSSGSRKDVGDGDYDDEDSEYARENAFLEDMAE